MRQGRLTITTLAALAIMAIGPAWAAATPSSFVDDVSADFNAGTADASTAVVDPGSVHLNGTLATESFHGTVLPTSLSFAPWSSGGTATVNEGLTLNEGLVSGNQSNGPGQVLEFTGTFASNVNPSGAAGQHLGFAADDLTNGPWAIFTTRTGGGLAVSTTLDATAGKMETALTAPTNFTTAPHAYRIEWSATEVRFLVDGDLKATHPVAITSLMHPVVSDLNTTTDGTAVVKVDSLGQLRGTFQSVVHDAGDAAVAWGALTAGIDTPAGTAVTFETRSGQTGMPDASWSPWEPVTSGGTIPSPGARYIQYRANLRSSDRLVTPSVDRIEVGFDDSTPPSATIDGVQVSGTTATVSFSSPASDLGHFTCSLDGGAPATCTSPNQLSGLTAGSHTVSVQAVDKVGNVGSPDAKTFSVASPPASGGGAGATQQPSGGSSVADKTAPKVSVVARSLRVSKSGAVSFRVGCPTAETSCKVTLQIKSAAKTVARKTVTVKGGKTVTVKLALTKAARLQLTKHSNLKVSTVVTATDAAGNRRTTTKRMTLRPPSA